MAEQVDPKDLGEPDLHVAGLQLWVHGREFPEAMDYWDGNWVHASAHCQGKGVEASDSGTFLMIPDLVRWVESVEALLGGRSAEAQLEPVEPHLEATIRRREKDGRFTLEVRVMPDTTAPPVRIEFEVGRDDLIAIVSGCKAIVAKYPVRGSPTDGPANPPRG